MAASVLRHQVGLATGVAALFVGLAAAGCSAGSHGASGAGGGGGGGLSITTPLLHDAGMGGGCGADRYQVHRLPLDLLILLDRSSSMGLQLVASSATTKWSAMAQALSQSLAKAGADVNVALQVFPANNGAPRFCQAASTCQGPDGQDWGPCDMPRACSDGTTHFHSCLDGTDCLAGAPCSAMGVCSDGKTPCFVDAPGACGGQGCNLRPTECTGRYCSVVDYETPLLTMTSATTAATSITKLMSQVTPDGVTPWGPAVTGAINWATSWAGAHPDRVTAMLLATDGLPSEWTCHPFLTADIVALVKGAANGSPAVPTRVLGVFAPDEAATAGPDLNEVAVAGGGDSMYVVTAGAPAILAAQLGAALDSIRLALLPCQVQVPTPKAGTTLAYDMVNFEYLDPKGASQTIPYVPTEDACGTQPGWHYDVLPSQGTPASLVACPATCDAMKSSDVGQLNVVIGCATLIR